MRLIKAPEHTLLILVTGAVVLGLELIASRYMTPMFGSSLYVWGAILSMTLACLSIGYSWGGRLAEKLPNPLQRFILLVLLSATWIAMIPFTHRPIAHLAIEAGPTFGPILISTLLFALPIVALATATPIVFGENNRLRSGKSAATLIGDLFAISTFGSVFGALVTAYLIIPNIGLRSAFFCLSGTLFAVCTPYIWRGLHLRLATLLLVSVALLQLAYPNNPSADLKSNYSLIHRQSSPYAELAVIEDRLDGSRILLLDGTSQNWISGVDFDVSEFTYPRIILEHLSQYPSTNRRALVLGLGAGVLTKNLTQAGYQVDTVEIDPSVLDIAKDFFNFDAEHPVYLEDARAFLNRAHLDGSIYGLVLIDVFVSSGQPGHLFDLEAFSTIRSVLADDGVLASNQVLNLNRQDNQLALHTLATLTRVFPEVRSYDIHPSTVDNDLSSLVIFASNNPPTDPQFRSGMGEKPFIRDLSSVRAITDNWNPIDIWSVDISEKWHRNIRSWLGTGASIPI